MLSTPRLPTQTRPYRFCVHRATGFTLQCELTFALVCQGLTQSGGDKFSQPTRAYNRMARTSGVSSCCADLGNEVSAAHF